MISLFRKSSGDSENLHASALKERMKPGDVVIDVRTPGEYASGHVEGARNLNLHAPDFQQRIDELDRDGTYYVYCRSGSRSGMAVRMMRQMGFAGAYNVGGIAELARNGVRTSR